METTNFKVQLDIVYKETNYTPYLKNMHDIKDEISDLHLNCLYNWISVDGDKDRQNWHKLTYGFCDDDFDMEVRYNEDGYLDVTLSVSDTFDKHVPVLYNFKDQLELYVRTLREWIVMSIDGQMSDGIGENPVGTCAYKNGLCEIWLGRIITDNDDFFIVNDPIHVEKNRSVILSYMMPGYMEDFAELQVECKKCFKNNKVIDHEKAIKLYKQVDALRDKNNAYIIEKLKVYKY